MNTSFTEENYLKTIFKLSEQTSGNVSTNAIAEALQTKASSVTDMIKKLGEKNLLEHTRYQGVSLTTEGRTKALGIVRRHRLWEVFLVKKLGMGWDEVHDIAEQLEHTNSLKLYAELDKFLNYPKYDPHGDPIPDSSGNMLENSAQVLAELKPGSNWVVQGIADHNPEFLQYLDLIGLIPGAQIHISGKFEFDGSLRVRINGNDELVLSAVAAGNILVQNPAL
ncbi:MAG: metal-dependent transcriptional regulator [Bacteroidetes bacterium]|nr:metal-dependent transcriptional regulator [Bacteroidota bacterium]